MGLGIKSTLEIVRAVRNPAVKRNVMRTIAGFATLPPATCNCCGYVGKFDAAGDTVRSGAECPKCKSRERHRLLTLAHQKGFFSFRGEVLHFAPEPIVTKLIRNDNPAKYVTADINPQKADIVLNIEMMDLPDASFDTIMCSHVLEHVNDIKALSEMKRILRPGGQALLMTPVIEGWRQTYENVAIKSEADRFTHFAQRDHVRYFGADFRDRIRAAGFSLDELTGTGEEAAKYSLMRGETLFRAAA